METEEFLAHYGIMGMKWGKRKAAGSSSTPKVSRKEARREKNVQIVNARLRQQARETKYANLATRQALMVSKKGQQSIAKQMDKLKNEILDGNDAKTAQRLTTGEAVVTGIAWGGIALAAIGVAASTVER